MFNILRIAFLVTIGLVGFAWKLFVAFLNCVPDRDERGWVNRYEVPGEPRHASFTRDGKQIIG